MFGSVALADDDPAECAATIKLFQDAGESASFFKKSYGYAVFPTIGKAGLGIGGAHGSGCVFEKGKQVGTAKMNQLSFGWQAGAQGYSLLVFFEDDRAFKDFTSGNFEFGAKASAVAITAGASAGAGTQGTSSGASARKEGRDDPDPHRLRERHGLLLDHQGWADVRGQRSAAPSSSTTRFDGVACAQACASCGECPGAGAPVASAARPGRTIGLASLAKRRAMR
jgi:hypothetical protein